MPTLRCLVEEIFRTKEKEGYVLFMESLERNELIQPGLRYGDTFNALSELSYSREEWIHFMYENMHDEQAQKCLKSIKALKYQRLRKLKQAEMIKVNKLRKYLKNKKWDPIKYSRNLTLADIIDNRVPELKKYSCLSIMDFPTLYFERKLVYELLRDIGSKRRSVSEEKEIDAICKKEDGISDEIKQLEKIKKIISSRYPHIVFETPSEYPWNLLIDAIMISKSISTYKLITEYGVYNLLKNKNDIKTFLDISIDVIYDRLATREHHRQYEKELYCFANHYRLGQTFTQIAEDINRTKASISERTKLFLRTIRSAAPFNYHKYGSLIYDEFFKADLKGLVVKIVNGEQPEHSIKLPNCYCISHILNFIDSQYEMDKANKLKTVILALAYPVFRDMFIYGMDYVNDEYCSNRTICVSSTTPETLETFDNLCDVNKNHYRYESTSMDLDDEDTSLTIFED